MAQGEFTIKETDQSVKVIEEIMKAFPKRKAMDFIGHFNDVFLYLAAAKKHLEEETK